MKNNKVLSEVTILALDNRTGAFYNTISDKNGRFVFGNIMAKDSIDWTFQALDGQQKITDCVIEFDNHNYSKPNKVNLLWQMTTPETTIETLATATIKEDVPNKTNKEIRLSEVTVKAKRTAAEPRKLYHADYTITAQDIKDIGSVATDNVLRVLQNRVPGFTMGEYFDQKTGLSKISIRLRGFNSFEGNNQPLFLVNGIPFGEDANLLEAISINDVAKIEVIRSAAGATLYGTRGTSGIIAITTKSGATGNLGQLNEPVQGVFRLKKAALYSQKIEEQKNNNWWPLVSTDSLGRAKLKINPALLGSGKIIKIQGLTDDGRLFVLTKQL